MTLTRGRILRGEGTAAAVPVPRAQGHDGSRRIPAVVAAASDRARAVLRNAEEQARAVLAEAERQAAEIKLAAHEIGRAEAAAALAAYSVKLARVEAEQAERSLGRSIDLAKMLAERLLGSALALDSSLITTLARQALDEARGARQIRIHAHPDDAAVLRRELTEHGECAEIEIADAGDLAPGDLKIDTEIGSLDVRIEPRLERLTRRLRETLRPRGEAP